MAVTEPPGSRTPHQRLQRTGGVTEVLQDEADEGVIEARRREGEVEDVGMPEGHIGEARRPHPPPRGRQRRLGDVDGGEGGPGAVAGQDDRLGPDPAAHLEHLAARRIDRIGVEQLGQGRRLSLSRILSFAEYP
jgi:hypothetical protein